MNLVSYDEESDIEFEKDGIVLRGVLAMPVMEEGELPPIVILSHGFTNRKKDVLLFHGDADNIVGISYSERASQEYSFVTFQVVEGGGHNGMQSPDMEILRKLWYHEK